MKSVVAVAVVALMSVVVSGCAEEPGFESLTAEQVEALEAARFAGNATTNTTSQAPASSTSTTSTAPTSNSTTTTSKAPGNSTNSSTTTSTSASSSTTGTATSSTSTTSSSSTTTSSSSTTSTGPTLNPACQRPNAIALPSGYYLDDRSVTVNGIPIPGTGYLNDGTWIYQESNGVAGLQLTNGPPSGDIPEATPDPMGQANNCENGDTLHF